VAGLDKDHRQILGLLQERGIASTQDLRAATGKSQPTVSRLLADLSSQVLTLGKGRATRYGLSKSIRGFPAQQPVWWTSEQGDTRQIGTLTLLANDIVHVDTDLVSSTTANALPWYLTPLQAQGFLGRLTAQRLAPLGIGSDPDGWTVETTLFVALHLHDPSGAFTIGELAHDRRHAELPSRGAALEAALDEFAADVAKTLPAGSSAGGEQPKFLALQQPGQHVLVKFTPPRGTPFGTRWSDLLHAEALASRVLGDHGVPVAKTTMVESPRRTYLLSDRFDRIGIAGRRHVVSVGAVHRAFVADAYAHWGATCNVLARQRRLPAQDAARAGALLQFGRLIGNTDMHSGNLGLCVRPQDILRGRFELAPVFDMLPMRWRPDAVQGGVPDYAPFEPDAASAAGPAAEPARDFWSRLAAHDGVTRGLRQVAAQMDRRLGGA
jgi:hypothetical protein